ncbi:hypothetical protein WJX72_007627 [[Myrmecia] bisecta]|uniref:Uncharacterized protein n=1 Tax=[Myrmecia] bisecta TaxID=41462 RepID=A0AAW1QBU4_9CHLO
MQQLPSKGEPTLAASFAELKQKLKQELHTLSSRLDTLNETVGWGQEAHTRPAIVNSGLLSSDRQHPFLLTTAASAAQVLAGLGEAPQAYVGALVAAVLAQDSGFFALHDLMLPQLQKAADKDIIPTGALQLVGLPMQGSREEFLSDIGGIFKLLMDYQLYRSIGNEKRLHRLNNVGVDLKVLSIHCAEVKGSVSDSLIGDGRRQIEDRILLWEWLAKAAKPTSFGRVERTGALFVPYKPGRKAQVLSSYQAAKHDMSIMLQPVRPVHFRP